MSESAEQSLEKASQDHLELHLEVPPGLTPARHRRLAEGVVALLQAMQKTFRAAGGRHGLKLEGLSESENDFVDALLRFGGRFTCPRCQKTSIHFLDRKDMSVHGWDFVASCRNGPGVYCGACRCLLLRVGPGQPPPSLYTDGDVERCSCGSIVFCACGSGMHPAWSAHGYGCVQCNWGRS